MKTCKRVHCICNICGFEFQLTPSAYGDRIKKGKNGKIFCSIQCAAKHSKRLWEKFNAAGGLSGPYE